VARRAPPPAGGDIAISLPVYAAETDRRAREEPEASTTHFFRSLGRALPKGDGGKISHEQVFTSMRLFADRVIPRLT
jgi:hypothetical protein